MKPIIIELHREQNFVYGRVVDMPEELKGTSVIAYQDSYIIGSGNYPEIIRGKVLALWGNESSADNTWFHYQYNNAQEAIKATETFEKLIEEWNDSHIDILDEKEEEYLTAVIKPFKEKIKCVQKFSAPGRKEYIGVVLKSEETIYFPCFDEGTMYKQMKINRKYTLKELGLQ